MSQPISNLLPTVLCFPFHGHGQTETQNGGAFFDLDTTKSILFNKESPCSRAHGQKWQAHERIYFQKEYLKNTATVGSGAALVMDILDRETKGLFFTKISNLKNTTARKNTTYSMGEAI